MKSTEREDNNQIKKGEGGGERKREAKKGKTVTL